MADQFDAQNPKDRSLRVLPPLANILTHVAFSEPAAASGQRPTHFASELSIADSNDLAMQKRRGPWAPHEDQQLLELVRQYGAAQWVKIAEQIGSRSPKQCRERYHQNLKPTLDHSPITADEGARIERMVGEVGKRWAAIARELPGRSDNAVKNWWNGCQNRQRRLGMRQRHYREHDESSVSDFTPSPMLSHRPAPIDVNRSNQISSSSALSTPSLMSDSWSSASSRYSSSPITPAVRLDRNYGYATNSHSHSAASSHYTTSVGSSPVSAYTPRYTNPYGCESYYPRPESVSPSAVSIYRPQSVSPLALPSIRRNSTAGDDERPLRPTLPLPMAPPAVEQGPYHHLRDQIRPGGRPHSYPSSTYDDSVVLPPLLPSPLHSLAQVAADREPAPPQHQESTASAPPTAASSGGSGDDRMKISRFL